MGRGESLCFPLRCSFSFSSRKWVKKRLEEWKVRKRQRFNSKMAIWGSLRMKMQGLLEWSSFPRHWQVRRIPTSALWCPYCSSLVNSGLACCQSNISSQFCFSCWLLHLCLISLENFIYFGLNIFLLLFSILACMIIVSQTSFGIPTIIRGWWINLVENSTSKLCQNFAKKKCRRSVTNNYSTQ